MNTTSNTSQQRNGKDLAPRPSAPARRIPQTADTPQVGPASTNTDLAAAAIQARAQRRSRTRLRRRLSLALKRPHMPARAALAMLEAEADHIGPGRDPTVATYGEILVQQAAKASADSVVARSRRRLDKHAEAIEMHQARRVELITRARYRATDLVRHPDGGVRSVVEVVLDERAQRTQIEDECANGSRKHRRLPHWIGRVPRLVLIIDFCLLLYFFAGITDVDWASPLSADLVFAVLLAAMVTILSYGFLAFAGHRLRSHKDHSGAIPLQDLDGLTKTSAAAAITVIAVLAVLMFIRMRTEVLYALGLDSGATALLVALALAVVSALSNFLIIVIHALDGSDQTARLESLANAASRPLAQARRLQEEADIIPSRIALLRRRADRDAARVSTDADQHTATATKIINAARIRHQTPGPRAGVAYDLSQHHGAADQRNPAIAPAPDLRQLSTAKEHINAGLRGTSRPQSP